MSWLNRRVLIGVMTLALAGLTLSAVPGCGPILSGPGAPGAPAAVPPHTGIFIERDGTFVELDRVTRSLGDSSISPEPSFRVTDERPVLIVYHPGESPSDLHLYRVGDTRPLPEEDVPINSTPKGSDVVHVQPQQGLLPGRYVIHHGEGRPFLDTPAWGFVIVTS